MCVKKEFNVTGTCVPQKHYMVDISGKIAQVRAMIEKEQYFTINRARQYGKTTMLAALHRSLREKYLVIRMSFEGTGNLVFERESSFVRFFIRAFGQKLQKEKEQKLYEEWNLAGGENACDFLFLNQKITTLCEKSDREVILMIDEVDKSSDNQIFLNFLGMLREKYLERAEGEDASFKSVILAGVYDIF